MFSRAARITRAVPLRARPTLVAGSRAVTTNAASATLEKGVPQVRRTRLPVVRRQQLTR